MDPYQSPSPPPVPPQPADRSGPGPDAGMRLLLPVGRSGWAIAAGYLGLFSVLLVPAPFALLVSIMAIRHLKKSALTASPKHGMGRAIFGLIFGLLGTIGLLIVLFLGMMSQS